MALTTFEKQVARHMLKYYSGDVPQVPEDDSKIQAFLVADEAGKRTIIKAFLQNIILPIEQVQLTNLQNVVTTTQARITQIQNYIAS